MIKIEIKFAINNNLIYYISKNKQFCIFTFCEKIIFELIYDQNNYKEYYRVYQHLINTIYILRLLQKICQYIKHCLFYELNKTKRYTTYKKLILIAILTILFCTIVINFIIILSKKFNLILIVICKILIQINLIVEKST